MITTQNAPSGASRSGVTEVAGIVMLSSIVLYMFLQIDDLRQVEE